METALARLPALSGTQDVHRNRAGLQPSPFGWGPVWNRTEGSSYYHNHRSSETRSGEVDARGPYRIVHLGPTAVSSWVNVLDGDVATLWPGTPIEVLGVVHREDLRRVRARIKRPAGWISLVNTESGYRFAVRAEVYILVGGAPGAPGIVGRYERTANEVERGEAGHPRFKQVNGEHFLRLCYCDAAVWMITPVEAGPPGDGVVCDSRYYEDPFPVSASSLPPTFPAAWCPAGGGLGGPAPSLVIEWVEAGGAKKRSCRSHLRLGIVRLDRGYDALADEVDSSAGMGYDLTYRVVPGLTDEAARSGQLTEQTERNLAGAIQRLEQRGALAITADSAAMLAFQPAAQEAATRPVFLSPLTQWLALSCAFAPADRFLILTGDAAALAAQGELLAASCGLDLREARFVVRGCQDIAGFRAVVRGEEIPSEGVEAAVVQLAMAALQEEPLLGSPRGVLLECPELLPYADALRAASGLPVWDAVTAADFHLNARHGYEPFGLCDWQEELEQEHGLTAAAAAAAVALPLGEGRRLGGGGLCAAAAPEGPPAARKQRILGVLGLDYENAAAPREYVCPGSRGYQVLFRSIPDLTRYLTSLGKLIKAVEKEMKDAISWMEERGICALTGDAGFMMAYQLLLRDHAGVPVFMSPMLQCRTVAAALAQHERLLVLTADDAEMEPQRQIFRARCGFDLGDPRYVVCGCRAVPGFAPVLRGEAADVGAVVAGLVGMVTELLGEWLSSGVRVGAICLECPQLCPYADALRYGTGLPVFDAVTCAELFVSARHDNFRFGIKQWPYEWDRKAEDG